MPSTIEHCFEKIMRDFKWAREDNTKSSPPIRITMLTDQIDHGGQKLLEMKFRNKATDLMELKTHLKPFKEGPV